MFSDRFVGLVGRTAAYDAFIRKQPRVPRYQVLKEALAIPGMLFKDHSCLLSLDGIDEGDVSEAPCFIAE